MSDHLRIDSVLIILVCVILCVGGCSSSPPASPPDEFKGFDSASPQKVPGKKTGTFKPYKIAGKTYYPLSHAQGFSQKGLASWYGKKFHGRKTANGETYNMYAMTAAHKTLPMNTWVQVTNLDNKKKVVLRINDRGPFVADRIIDLSYTGAKKLGVVGPGTAKVKVVALGKSSGKNNKKYIPVDCWNGDFTVQVGAFSVLSNARAYKKKLLSRYKNVHITTHTDYRGTFYRVRVGKFSRLKSADAFKLKLSKSGIKGAFTVAR
ncbi:rare lipoprotein A [Desulfocicer vacuolatum DSM 3385]|uniref:Probable endolytic peptidoglycan transglycosylase RlpA n=1 Tax=Desulfocicer vacuolatum DSM 3385 TaxID=1121400 RepID=A0A1W2CA13_9BACT|nr:septal ring lytic transglycosylase RlpA family protein [Desulfocicer vacuolatum]SMC82117.1 rare lipoprotein A [Desulfocicer vacuolatum DSM 3385]